MHGPTCIFWADLTFLLPQRQKLGFIHIPAKAGDLIIMPLRLNHAVLPAQPGGDTILLPARTAMTATFLYTNP
jgi:hypothetical protein